MLALFLLPSVGTALFVLIAGPWLVSAGLPPDLPLPLGFLLVGMPIELGYLLSYARRHSGRRRLSGAILLAERKPIWVYLTWTAVLFGYAFAALMLLAPTSAYLAEHVFAGWPQAFTADGLSNTHAPSANVVILCLAFATVIDGVLNPIVEELYFRGNLMPRISSRGYIAVPVCALLFSLQHYWQPYNYVFLFVLQLGVCLAVWKTRSVYVGIAAHVTANLIGLSLTWMALLYP